MTFFADYADRLRAAPPETVRRELAHTDTRLAELSGDGGEDSETVLQMWRQRRKVTAEVLAEKTEPVRPVCPIIFRARQIVTSGVIADGPDAGERFEHVFERHAAARPGERLAVTVGPSAPRWFGVFGPQVREIRIEAR